MPRRSGKFYSKNEKSLLQKLGFKPAVASGAGWIEKEDGENEAAMVQLKSTDAQSYTVKMLDLKKLEYHANVSNKVPIFLIEFLQQDKVYALVDIDDIEELSRAIKTGEKPKEKILLVDDESMEVRKKVKSSVNAREKFFEERSKKFERRR